MENKILDKLKKLQAYTTENGCTEAEAANAAAKIQELLFAHNLSMRDVDGFELPGTSEAYDKADCEIPANRATLGWKRGLAHGIANLNFCELLSYPGTTRVSIVGKRSNIEAVCYLSQVLITQIDRLAKEAVRSVLQNKARYMVEFCEGARGRVIQRLKEQRAAAEAGGQSSVALVRQSSVELASAFKGFFPHTATSTRRISSRTSGYGDGTRAGNSVGLSRGGIGTGNRRSLSA